MEWEIKIIGVLLVFILLCMTAGALILFITPAFGLMEDVHGWGRVGFSFGGFVMICVVGIVWMIFISTARDELGG